MFNLFGNIRNNNGFREQQPPQRRNQGFGFGFGFGAPRFGAGYMQQRRRENVPNEPQRRHPRSIQGDVPLGPIHQNIPPQGFQQGNVPPQGRQGYNQGTMPPQGQQRYNQGTMPPQGNQGLNQGTMPPQGNQGYNQGTMPPQGNQGYNQGTMPPQGQQGYNQGTIPPSQQGHNPNNMPPQNKPQQQNQTKPQRRQGSERIKEDKELHDPRYVIRNLIPVVDSCVARDDEEYTLEHRMMEVCIISYLMGKGYDYDTSEEIAKHWERNGLYPRGY